MNVRKEKCIPVSLVVERFVVVDVLRPFDIFILMYSFSLVVSFDINDMHSLLNFKFEAINFKVLSHQPFFNISSNNDNQTRIASAVKEIDSLIHVLEGRKKKCSHN